MAGGNRLKPRRKVNRLLRRVKKKRHALSQVPLRNLEMLGIHFAVITRKYAFIKISFPTGCPYPNPQQRTNEMTDKMPDEWFSIYGWEGLYEVTKCGQIRNAKTGRILIGSTDQFGYRRVLLSNRGKFVCRLVHKLVLETFLPRPENTVINHKDGNPSNNNLCNLEYVSQRENVSHGKSCKRAVGITFLKKRNKWQSRLAYQGKRIFLGYFDTDVGASQAYMQKIKELNLENKYAE